MTKKAIITVLALFVLSSEFALSSGVKFSIISEGRVAKTAPFRNAVIRDDKELKKVWKELKIAGKTPLIDFKNGFVIALSPGVRKGAYLEILSVAKKKNDVEVRFAVRPPKKTVSKVQEPLPFPYLLAKLDWPFSENLKVRFIKDIPKPPLPADNALGQLPEYTNVLKDYESVVVSQFLPLDRGNVWTYKVESKGKVSEETYSVVSVSDGWSVFDNFFGKEYTALKVEPSGNIFVSSVKGVQDFYTSDAQKSFVQSEFQTPAGKFNDLMVVRISKNGSFWFKDVYARGVGLVYHEHRSPKGNAKFTLTRAKVRGKTYPSN